MKRSMAVQMVQPTERILEHGRSDLPFTTRGLEHRWMRRASPWVGRPRRPSPHESWGLRLPGFDYV
jgi:hypothetical protein